MQTQQLYFSFAPYFNSINALENNTVKYGNSIYYNEYNSQNNAIEANCDNLIAETIKVQGKSSQLWYLAPNFSQLSQSGFSIINKATGLAIKYNGQDKAVTLAENQFGNKDLVWQIQSISRHHWQIFCQDTDLCLGINENTTTGKRILSCEQNFNLDSQQFIMTLAEIDEMEEVKQMEVSMCI